MKNIITLGLLLLTTFLCNAQKKEIEIQHSGTKEEKIYGLRTMDIDKEGNKYVAGLYYNELNIDTFHLKSSLGAGVYLAKYDKLNKLIWVKSTIQSKPNNMIATLSIKSNLNNSILMSISYADSIKVENTYFKNAGSTDILFLKINSNGNIMNQLKVATPCGEAFARHSIGIDNDNNYYFAGSFGYSDSNTICNLTINGLSITDSNLSIFLLKTDSNFNTIWLKRYGDKYPDYISNIYVQDDKIYIAGINSKKFDSLIINYPTDFTVRSYLVALDKSGTPKWSRYYGMKSSPSALGTTSICVKGKFIYFTGSSPDYQFYFQTSNFIGYTSVSGYNVLPQGDYFIACYDTVGNYKWAKASQSYGEEYISQLAVDSNNNLLATGKFGAPMAMGIDTLNSYGSYDVFVTSLDSNGNYLWSCNAGGAGVEVGNGIATTTDGEIYIVGGTASSTCYFGQDTVQIDSLPSMFLAKIVNANPVSTEQLAVSNVQWDVFPNPTSDEIVVSCKLQQGVSNASMYLYNVLGQQVYYAINFKSTNDHKINVSNLPAGIYFLQLKQQGKTSTQKINIIH